MNQFKSNTEKPVEEDSKHVKGQADEILKKASDVAFLPNKESLGKLMPPIFLTVVLTIIYISLSHVHVKTLKEKDELKTELNELRSEYISVKSNLMKQSKQSEVAKRLEGEGLKELRTPPIIIESSQKK